MPTRRLPDDHKRYTTPPCRSADHSPPSHMVYDSGIYEHTCSACGRVTIFTVPRVTHQTHSYSDLGGYEKYEISESGYPKGI